MKPTRCDILTAGLKVGFGFSNIHGPSPKLMPFCDVEILQAFAEEILRLQAGGSPLKRQLGREWWENQPSIGTGGMTKSK